MLLEYLYTNQLKVDHDNIVDVMLAANRFRLDEMKQRCEKMIMTEQENWIGQENVIELLTIAELCNSPSLKYFCLQYILNHFNDFSLQDLKKIDIQQLKDDESPFNTKLKELLQQKLSNN